MSQVSFLKYLEFEKRYSPHTLDAYKTDLNQFGDYLSAEYEVMDIKDAQYLHIRSWIVQLMQADISPRSINRKLSALKAFFKYAMKRGLVTANPTLKVIAPKPSKPLPVFLHAKQTESLFQDANFPEGFAGTRDRLVMEILYNTGMRRAELIGLSKRNVDLVARQLKVLGKGNKERIIPFGKQLGDFFVKYLAERKDVFPDNIHEQLILTDKGKPLYPKFVYNLVKRYLSIVTTLEKRSPHVMRHTFATHLSDKGANLNAVKELLGHSSLAATQVYTHNSIEKLKQIYKQAHPKSE